MSASVNAGYPVPNFPAVGWVGVYGIAGYQGGPAAQVLGDSSLWVGGYLMFTLLAELRVQTQLLYALLGTEPTQLAQLRQDAISDMGTLYTTQPVAPVPSS